MKSNRNVYIIYFGLCGVLGLFLLMSGGSSDDELTAALPPPGPGAGMEGAGGMEMLLGPGAGAGGQEGDSIFESQFFNEHRPDSEEQLETVGEEDTEILEPAHKDNPVNPQTGLPYPDKLMDRFKALREKFPGNSVIPRRMTGEDKQADKRKRQDQFALRTKVRQGNANEEEINQHFNTEAKGIQDRLEILDYIMEKQQSSMSPEIKKQYEKILARNKEQLANIEKRREDAISKYLDQ